MEEIKQMATREGFRRVFWSRLKSCRGVGKDVTMREIFRSMEEEYVKEYGSELYSSFDAFKKDFYRHG